MEKNKNKVPFGIFPWIFHGFCLYLHHRNKTEREVGVCQRETFYEYTDLFNAHHFDCRGLIEKGLALEAPEDMYKEK